MYTLMNAGMGVMNKANKITIEIMPKMPDFASSPVRGKWNTTIAGFPCLVVKPRILKQYYINCKKFVVMVEMYPIPDEEFLNSFRLEK